MSDTEQGLTPETDATLEQGAYWGDDMLPTKETVLVARRLERERDELRMRLAARPVRELSR